VEREVAAVLEPMADVPRAVSAANRTPGVGDAARSPSFGIQAVAP
jgi:hypothetical protein